MHSIVKLFPVVPDFYPHFIGLFVSYLSIFVVKVEEGKLEAYGTKISNA